MFLDIATATVRYGSAFRSVAALTGGRHAPTRPAVDGASLALEAGQIGVLIGPSGCGKTSLLRAVAGLEPLAGGHITIGGEVLSDAAAWPALAPVLAAAGVGPGRFATERRVAVTAADKAALRACTGADAVEMESGVIVRACRAAGVPAAIVRAVSDAAEDDLPLDFNALMSADGRLDGLRLALAVASRPWRIPALLRLGRGSRHAAERLGEVLWAVLARREEWMPRT
ncbi:MAG: ATP-binding cassette domain-containing protein [Limisphaerales bacterium]